MSRILARFAAVLLMFALAAPNSTFGREPSEQDRLIDQLAIAIAVDSTLARPNVTGVRDDLLAGLRVLRDPALRPLFVALAESDNPGLRLHGVLGAAEIDPSKGLDTILLSRVKKPEEQAQILAQAMRQDLVGLDQIKEILAWKDLSPEVEILALGRMVKLGQEVRGDRLRVLAGDKSLAVGVMAGLLLLQTGATDVPEPDFERLFHAPEALRRPVLGILLQYIRRENLTGADPFVMRAAHLAEGDHDLSIEAAQTLLSIAPADGASLWMELYAGDLGTKLLLALAALETCDTAPVGLFDTLAADHSSDLLVAMGEAGRKVARKEDPTSELVALAALAHAPSCAWAIDRARPLTDESAASVGAAVIEAAAKAGPRRTDMRVIALPAAAMLAERAPGALIAAVDRACAQGDDGLCEMLLAGALRSKAASNPIPATQRRWPSRACRSLNALLVGRFDAKPTPEQITELKEAAMGGSLARLFRVQAAWLALRIEGQDRVALARLLASK